MTTLGPSRLRALLDDAQSFDCEYRGGLSNHLPMALTALHALGADDGRLSAFSARYAPRLAPAPPVGTWESGQAWAARLGERDAFAAYRALFTEWLLHERPEVALPQVLPVLMRGVGAAAFHGLIRTAYAVHARHLGELADGLAYWACRFLPLGDLPEANGRELDPEMALSTLRAGASEAGLIFERMRDAADHPQMHAAVAALRIGDRTLADLAWLSAYAYASTGDFTVMHLVTSAHALRLLLPFIDEPEQVHHAVRWYWQAWVAAVIAAGMERTGDPALVPWDTLVAKAVASDDDHLIKLVHSCREETKVYGGVAWQYAASRAVAGAAG